MCRYCPYEAGAYLPQDCRFLHITNVPEEVATAPVGDSLVADAGLALEALSAAVTSYARHAPIFEHNSQPPTRSDPPTAEAVFAALAGVRTPDLLVVEKSLSNLALLRKQLSTRQRSGLFTMASGILGSGLPRSVWGQDSFTPGWKGSRRSGFRAPGGAHAVLFWSPR